MKLEHEVIKLFQLVMGCGWGGVVSHMKTALASIASVTNSGVHKN